MQGWSVLALVFLATWLAVVGVWLIFEERRRRTLERFAILAGLPLEEANADQNRSVLAGMIQDRGFQDRLRMELWRAGIETRPTDFLCLIGLAGVLAAGFAWFATHNVFAIPFGLAMGIGGGVTLLKVQQGQRRAKLEAQLPDALDMTSSSLRSGYSFLQSIQVVTKEMPAPISQETQRVLDDVNVGMTLDEALERMATRVQSYDVDLLVTAIGIQTQVGGNLAHLLNTIAETVRERFRNRSEISALTAEGRLSGMVLFLLPLGLLVILTLRNPEYMRPLFEHPMGQTMLGGALALQAVGGLIMKKMLTVDA